MKTGTNFSTLKSAIQWKLKRRAYWLTFGLLFIIAAVLAFIFIPSNSKEKITIGILATDSLPQKELNAIENYLDENRFFKYHIIDLNKSLTKLPVLEKFDVLWYHQLNTQKVPDRLNNIRMNDSIKAYLNNGGHMLLTMEGMKYLNDLRLEKAIPTADTVKVIDNGYGRKRGLHAYKHHPVFKDLNGGAFIFGPETDTITQQTGFMGNTVPENGKVIAVDWSYVNFKESKKLMVEYRKGEGKVIGIGAYTIFDTPNKHQPQLEQFMNNVFGYLSGSVGGERNYWNYDRNSVEPFNVVDREMNLPQSKAWNEKDWSLAFENPPTDNFWDIAGERMLIMGKENEGIEEIWAHPFMALQDYQIGYRHSDSAGVNWLNNSIRKVKITPNALIRTYSIGKSQLREIITADIKDPVGAVHYDYTGEEDIRLVIKYKTRMRTMWPYSSKVNSVIKQTWNDNLNAHLYIDNTSDMTCITGAGKKPVNRLSGQYSGFTTEKGDFKGQRTNDFVAATIAEYQLNSVDHLDFVIAATNRGMGPATSVYREYMKRPEKVYEQSQKYYEELLAEHLIIESPDEKFNEAYKWAMIGADRFFVNTPGLGKSLVAGYGTTANGWDGDHDISGRPGYAWYFGRDGQWSGFALDGYGDFKKVRDILKIYMDFQSPRGKIFHELTTSGVAHYDAADATPLFIVLAGHYLRHSGDKEFIKNNWRHIEKAIDFCFSTDRNNDHLIENKLVGHGWVEGGHLFGGRSTLYLSGCWAGALEEAAYMANAVGKSGERRYRNEAKKVRELINDTLWNEQQQFFRHSIKDDGTFIEDKTVMPAIPLYFRQIEKQKSTPVLREFARNNFSSDWGVRIVGKDNPHFDPEGYHTGTVWPLYTGWTALAEYKNDRPLQGFIHTMNNLHVYDDWSKGFIEEVMHGVEYKPSGVCAHQCWSQTMALQPLIEGMLGFRPNATEHKMTLEPAFPVQWDNAEVKNIRMADQGVDLTMNRKTNSINYRMKKTGSRKLKMLFNPYLPVGSRIDSVMLNGSRLDYQIRRGEEFVQLQSGFSLDRKARLAVYYSQGFAVVPPTTTPQPGDKSDGLRIIRTNLRDNIYSVTVEGPVGSTKLLHVITGDNKVKYVEGARLMEYMQSKVKIRITFRSENQEEGYIEKTFKLIMETS
ncbi:MAG: hypothetical protein K9J27_06760 [Bacteroidales bacterium]|nr:hypothetical protein [Bacteroidales bacterium]MCF8333465.1 hypothetical protein [Bacteroidales bacterium]